MGRFSLAYQLRRFSAAVCMLLLVTAVGPPVYASTFYPTASTISGPALSVVGDTVTFTTYITESLATDPPPTGTVTFMDGEIMIGTGPALITNSLASVTVSNLTAGPHSITAVYGGDEIHSGSTTAVLVHTVSGIPTSTAISTSVGTPVYGSSVTITAIVSNTNGSTAAPSGGAVTFKDGPSVLGSATVVADTGKAILSTTSLGAGAHTLTAEYAGDLTHAGSVSATPASLTVTKVNTKTTLNNSKLVIIFGGNTTLTAKVQNLSSGSIPTGTVRFKQFKRNDTVVLGTQNLDASGSAILSNVSLPDGLSIVTAEYDGDGNYSSSASLTLGHTDQEIVKVPTSAALTTTATDSVFGGPVTFRVTVKDPNGNPLTSGGGEVTFQDGSTSIGSQSLADDGTASLTTSGLAARSHSITAKYIGPAESVYADSVSPAITQNVTEANTNTTLNTSKSIIIFGENTTLTAKVDNLATGSIPTGTVIFKNNGNLLGTQNLDVSGTANFSTSALTVGTHTLTAEYSGDGDHTASTSAITQTVNKATTVTEITYTGSTVFGHALKFTVQVTDSNGTVPTGKVTINDGTAELASGLALAGGKVTWDTGSLAVGPHSLTARYSGDGNHELSVSSPLVPVDIQRISATVQISKTGTGAVYYGTGVPLSVHVSNTDESSQQPTGHVVLKEGEYVLASGSLDADGNAFFTLEHLIAGTHQIIVVYEGDSFVQAATSQSFAVLIQPGVDSLRLTGGEWSKRIKPEGFRITAVIHGLESLTLLPTSGDTNVAFKLYPLDSSGHRHGELVDLSKVMLNPGINRFVLTLESKDGTTTTDYTVTIFLPMEAGSWDIAKTVRHLSGDSQMDYDALREILDLIEPINIVEDVEG